MDYIEKVRKECKEVWFRSHVAKLKDLGEVQVLYWDSPKCTDHAIKYVFSGCNVFISGDVGSAVFCLTEKSDPHKVAKYNLDYLLGKMEAFSESKYHFDEDKALDELDKWYWDKVSEYEDEDNEDEIDSFKYYAEQLDDAAKNWSDCESFEHAVYTICMDADERYLDGEDAEYLSKYGRMLNPRLISYHLGLQMAMEQFETVFTRMIDK